MKKSISVLLTILLLMSLCSCSTSKSQGATTKLGEDVVATPEQSLALEASRSIAAGNNHTIAIKADGTVVATGLSLSISTGNKLDWTDIVAVAEGVGFVIGLHSDGTVVAAGDNYDNQCNVEDWTDIVAISAGQWHTVGLRKDGTVVATVSDDEYKDCGQWNVSGWTDIVAISAGARYTVGLRKDGTVVAVGSNDEGQCDVSDWTDIVAISAGDSNTVGLRKDGTVVIAGNSIFGQERVESWTDIVAIAAGGEFTLGLQKDGTVITTRNNSEHGCDVNDWTNVIAIATDGSHTIGLCKDGTMLATGTNDYHECDVANWTNIKVPGGISMDDQGETGSPDNSEDSNYIPSETESTSPDDPELADPSGIIILTCTPPNNGTYVLGVATYTLQCLNVDTGEVTDIAQFSVDADYTSEVQYSLLNQKKLYANSQDRFSKDFSKMAITAQFRSDGGIHAGWIDASGHFFDVTDALGLVPHGDFSDPVYYYAYGFAEDGSFVFAKSDPNNHGLDNQYYYSIDPENLDPAAIKEGNPYLGYSEQYDKGLDSWNRAGRISGVTDWIDETHCIVDVGDNHSSTMIMDIEKVETTSYLPSNSRKCWDGIISPNGDKIAFLSRPNNGTELPSIYIVPTDGGEPVKLDSPIQFTYREYSAGKGDGFTTIIDWR